MSRFIWTPRYTEILLLVSKGEKVEDIARKTGYKTGRFVHKLIARPEFQEKLAKLNVQVDARLVAEGVKQIADEVFMKDAARKELERASLHAARTITQLLSRNRKLGKEQVAEMRLKFEAARDVLDRIGLKPREVVETIERNYTTEEIERAMVTMKELNSLTTNQFVFGGPAKIRRALEITDTDTVPLPTDNVTLTLPNSGDGVAEGTQSTIQD
jgi:hypothetical protein